MVQGQALPAGWTTLTRFAHADWLYGRTHRSRPQAVLQLRNITALKRTFGDGSYISALVTGQSRATEQRMSYGRELLLHGEKRNAVLDLPVIHRYEASELSTPYCRSNISTES
jgi:hypothetical protein